MIKAVIIDDEKDARFNLRRKLERFNVKVLGEADDVVSGIDLISEVRPAVVFLDVQMKTGTGFDLLEKMDEIDFEVVFVTAFDKYAIKAFQFSAVGYLLKPLKTREMENMIQSLEKRLVSKIAQNEKRLKVLIEQYDSREIKKLAIPSIGGFDVVNIQDIIRMEADRNYTEFHMKDGSTIVSGKTLKSYEEIIIEHGFFRIHQSTVVNLSQVVKYIKSDGGQVMMSDGAQLKIARLRKNDFLALFR